MFLCTNYLKTILKLNPRFISYIKKFDKQIITADERLLPDLEKPVSRKIVPISRKGTNFYENYSNKAIERLEVNDERFGSLIVEARSLNNVNNDLLVVEGVNMIRDAIKLGAEMTHLFFTNRDLLRDIPFKSGFSESNIYFVTYRTMKKFSNLKTPPGIMAVFKRPDPVKFLVDPFANKKLPLSIILDNIRDPGNLGTIIRTAAGFNVNKILMTKGCVNLYNDKVLRGSMSSIFCTPIFCDFSWDDIKNSLNSDCTVYYADVSNKNENTESFNYYDSNVVDFSDSRSYALVIGGEINGVSDEAKSLSSDTYGYKLCIPLVNSVNSLNSSVAAAIIISEFQRKFLLNKQ